MTEKIAIILAAGISSRMNTKLPKVLHKVCGRPMLAYVLDACRAVDVEEIYVVVGYGSEKVQQQFCDASDIEWIHQDQQKGTAHAVLCCKEQLKDFDGETLVVCGDMPLVRDKILKKLIEKHQSGHSAATLATAILDDPTGYGRIIRDTEGNIQGIVEEGDCTDEQRTIKEINPSYYIFDNKVLFEAIEKIKPDNVKNEYYLTDALAVMIKDGHSVQAVTAVMPEEAMGVNSRFQLSQASKIMQQRIQQDFMENGVTIMDPDNTWIDARAQIGQDTVIEPFTYINGDVKIGRGCRIGPFAHVRNGTVLGDGVVFDTVITQESANKFGRSG